MAIASVALVRRTGGLDEEDAYLRFRLGSEAELSSLIVEQLEYSAEWIQTRAPAAYAAAVLGTYQKQFAMAEVYFTLIELYQPLTARKVVGSHDSIDSEESAAYRDLIESWKERFEDFASQFFTVDTADQPVAFPYFGVSNVLDYTNVDSPEVELDEIAQHARGWNPASSR